MNVIVEALFVADSLKEIICGNVARLAKRDKLSGAEIARRLETAPPNVSRWISGKVRPDDEMLKRMHDRLGWALDELLWNGNESSKPIAKPKPQPPTTLDSIYTIVDALGFEKPKLKRKKASS